MCKLLPRLYIFRSRVRRRMLLFKHHCICQHAHHRRKMQHGMRREQCRALWRQLRTKSLFFASWLYDFKRILCTSHNIFSSLNLINTTNPLALNTGHSWHIYLPPLPQRQHNNPHPAREIHRQTRHDHRALRRQLLWLRLFRSRIHAGMLLFKYAEFRELYCYRWSL